MKIQKTFTIEKEVWDKYNDISKRKSDNKSLQLENFMKDIIYLEEDPNENFISYGNISIIKYQKPNGDIFTKKDENDENK